STSPETFACEVCQGEFLYQEVLQTHKLLHFNTSHVCYACDCYFLKTETLIGHMNTIHGNMSYHCNRCQKAFPTQDALAMHVMLHAKTEAEDEHQHLVMCKFCGIIFTDRTMYYLHMGLHNVNNPWQCNLCGKVCANVHQFSSH
ncbi:hypothetical protein CAPTEDRAFT_66282, partial [Capitella teleta]